MKPPAGDGDDEYDPREASRSIDATLEILADGLRRDVLEHCMDRADTPTTVDDLTDHLVRKREGERQSMDRDRILATLHHKHLPMLDDYGLIEFDPRTGLVRYRPNERVEEWLARVRAEESG